MALGEDCIEIEGLIDALPSQRNGRIASETTSDSGRNVYALRADEQAMRRGVEESRDAREFPGGNWLSLAALLLIATVVGVSGASLAAGGAVHATASSAGNDHHCALLANHTAHCWGNTAGKVPSFNENITALSVGGLHTCALLTDQNVACWWSIGSGSYSGGNARAITTGYAHACALLTGTNVVCWGTNADGQTVGYTGGDALALSSGSSSRHTCALLSNGNVRCWGDDRSGQAEPYNGRNATAVTVGEGHTCALLADGNVRCWGNNGAGQAVGYAGHDAVAVSAGQGHTCVLTSGKNVRCWGDNRQGQSAPYSGGDAIQVSAGWLQTCALLTPGYVQCWGNSQGASTEGYFVLPTASPETLVASSGDGAIRLSWTVVTNNTGAPLTGYHVHRINPDGSDQVVSNCEGLVVSCEDVGLPGGAQRRYWITAVNRGGEGPRGPIEPASGTLPSPPDNVQAIPDNTGNVGLTWSATGENTIPIRNFTVYRGNARGAESPVAEGECARLTNFTSCTDIPLRPGETRFYRVTATNTYGEGRLSASAQAGRPLEESNKAGTQAAARLVLSVQDLPYGWKRVQDDPTPESEQPGLDDQFQSLFQWTDDTGFSRVLLYSNAYVFNSTLNATNYYAGRAQVAQRDFSTDSPGIGEASVAWKDGEVSRLVFAKRNIVWSLVQVKQGFLDGGISINDAARKALAKFTDAGTEGGISRSTDDPGSRTPTLGLVGVVAAVVVAVLISEYGRRGRRG